MLSVVDPKGKGENKFRYVVVTQDEWLVCWCCFFWESGSGSLADSEPQRDRLRSVVPTPLMYVRRSVMVSDIVSTQSWREYWLTCFADS